MGSRLVNFAKTIRNNWKKSLFAAGVLAYGVDYAVDSYNVSKLMRVYCEQAVQYGNEPFELGKLKRITVILNPAANNKKAKKMFESYCAPILHLSGVYVSVVETEREGHARELIDTLEPNTDAIVVAGGDGTLSETITGLMRTRGELCQIPIGVVPLGNRNAVASAIFQEPEQHVVSNIASATLAVVKGNVKPIDAFRIEVLNEGNESKEKPRPVYGVGAIEWGLRREMRQKSDRLWWTGPLKDVAPLVFHGSRYHIGQDLGLIQANIRYSPPCDGCKNCYNHRPDLRKAPAPQQLSRWWNIMSLQNRRLATQNTAQTKDYSTVENDSCPTVKETQVVTSDLNLLSNILMGTPGSTPKLSIKVGPALNNQGQLLTDGYKILQNDANILSDVIEAKQVEITPQLPQESAPTEAEGECLSIDKEDYEVRPIRVSILPNSVKVFCK